MPELPEVESVRRSLDPVLGSRVLRVTLRRRDMLVVPGDPIGGWGRQGAAATGSPKQPKRYTKPMLLEGRTIGSTTRRGKRLAILSAAEDGQPEAALEIGLGMTGWLSVLAPRSTTPEHAHAIWHLDDGRRLVFVDPRRFGGLWAWPDAAAMHARWDETLGPDALTITGPQLASRLANTTRPLKAALLDQRVLAGVGNIYADESCFRSGIRPARRTSDLSRSETNSLAASLRTIMRAAVQVGGSTLQDFRDAQGNPGGYQHGHLVYGRGGEPCSSCGVLLEQSQLAQRTTVWCGRCQR